MKDDFLYLLHILERCQRIERFIAPGRDAFLGSEQTQDAVIRNIEVIGEAAKHITPETKAKIPGLDWRAICGMRDVLIHDYIGVDLDQVWNTALVNIPELARAVKTYLPGDRGAGSS